MAMNLDELLSTDTPQSEEFAPYVLKSSGERQDTINDPEFVAILNKLFDLKPEKSRDFTRDDIGMANLLQAVYRDKIRYCPQNQTWYIWDKQRWERQTDDGLISEKLQDLLNLLNIYVDEIEENSDEELIEKYRKFLSSCRKYHPMRGILKVFETNVRLSLSEMDNHPYILNTTNGAYDLRTGKQVENSQELNITKCTNTYPAHALTKRCDRWYQFIDEIMSGDKEKAKFLQRALGYSLLGVNKDECMFLAYGAKTRNGKGTLFGAIKDALSEDYADTASSALICKDSRGRVTDFNAPQPALAKIKSTRIVEMSENESDVILASAAMKAMTGRDRLVTRGLYENSFSFVPQFTLWLSTNYLPIVDDDSVFRSNRIWVIEFNESWADEGNRTNTKRDNDLKELFAKPENQPTILKWLMDGAAEYLRIGLAVPECVKQSTLNYRNRYDRINNFITECCELGDDKKIRRGDLHTAYTQWCFRSDNRYKPMQQSKFYAEMELRGFPVVKNSEWFYKGINLKPSNGKIPI